MITQTTTKPTITQRVVPVVITLAGIAILGYSGYFGYGVIMGKNTNNIFSIKKSVQTESPVLTTFTGNIHYVAFDDVKNPENGRTAIMLYDGTNDYELHCTDCVNTNYITGGVASIKGVLKQDRIIDFTVSNAEFTQSQREDFVWTPEFNLGEQKTLVLLATWDDKPLTMTSDEIRPYIFGPYPSHADLFSRNSAGKTWITGDIYGPFYLGAHFNTDYYRWIRESMTQLKTQNPSIDLASYKRVILVPEGFLGSGDFTMFYNGFVKNLPGGLTAPQSWTVAGWQRDSFLYLINHESGHGFGASHSQFLDCDGNAGDGFGNCHTVGYGNLFTLMAGDDNNFNAISKNALGWLSDNEKITATNGIFALSAANGSSGKRQIVVPYGHITNYNGNDPEPYFHYGDVDATYSIEYRKDSDYDSTDRLCEIWEKPELCPYRYGVFISLDAITAGGWHENHLIDTHPGTDSGHIIEVLDASLLAGEGYHDNVIGQTINVLSISSNSAEVQLFKDPVGCVRRQPTVTKVSTSPASYHPGDMVDFTLRMTNQDSTACVSNVFTAKVEAGDLNARTNTDLYYSIPSGQSQNFHVFVQSPVIIPPGGNIFHVVVGAVNIYYYKNTTDLTYDPVLPLPTCAAPNRCIGEPCSRWGNCQGVSATCPNGGFCCAGACDDHCNDGVCSPSEKCADIDNDCERDPRYACNDLECHYGECLVVRSYPADANQGSMQFGRCDDGYGYGFCEYGGCGGEWSCCTGSH